MIHDSKWFEMLDKRKPRLATASWVPIYARQVSSELNYGEVGHWEEYFGACAITFPAECGELVDQVEWSDVWRDGNKPRVEDGEYLPASRFVDWNSGVEGDYLVLRNWFETGDPDELLIDPDLILGLRLLREGDRWVAPHEDYVPVIRLQKDAGGSVVLIEIRGEHLKDYLCARDRGLLVSTFRSRREFSADVPPFELSESWKECGAYWEGRVSERDVRGRQYGSSVAIISMGRTDVDPDDDVPVMEAMTTSADKNLGSLKRLELVLDSCGANGRDSVRELVGIYELRHSDSHLPSSNVVDALALVGTSQELMPVFGGKCAIRAVAECLLRIAESIHPAMNSSEDTMN